MHPKKYVELFASLAFLVALFVLYGTATPEATVQQLALFPGSAALSSSASKAKAVDAEPPDTQAAPAPSVDAFGMDPDRFSVDAQRVQRNETFTDILSAHGVSYAEITRIARQARPDFDARRLRAGTRYRVYSDAWLDRARYFVYQPDPVRYVVVDLRDSVHVRTGERTVKVVQKRAEGTIRSSLYNALNKADVNPALAFDLSEVFAWQIDFYRIQKGDNFSVLYEEHQIDGRPVGLGNIVAARFEHRDDAYYGLYFEQDGDGDYFDEKGESLRKALLKAPLRYRRISSRYTKRRFHPVQKRWKAHLGTDYAAAPGTPVHSVGDGKIVEAGYTRGNGNWVKVRHNRKYTTGYLHFTKIAKGIKPGVEVEQGQVIGYVGSTGLATGPHVCYRFWKNGRQVDPLKEEMPSSNPVEDEHLAAYDHLKQRLLPRLRLGGATDTLAGRETAVTVPFASSLLASPVSR